MSSGVEVTIGEIEIPVTVDHVADVVTDGDFKLGLRNLIVDLGNEKAVIDSGVAPGPAIRLNSTPHLKQWLSQFTFHVGIPRGTISVAGSIVSRRNLKTPRNAIRAPVAVRLLSSAGVVVQVLLKRIGPSGEEGLLNVWSRLLK